MKYSLIGYQEDAALHLLRQLDKAKRRFREEDGERSSFALTATTGAGKTVIAAAVIEALFDGSSKLGFDADPTAVVLWLTHDPRLNEQTRQRMIQASDLAIPALVTIEANSLPGKLERHRVYFLNTQKLSVSSTLTKPVENRQHTLWGTIAATLGDPDMTLYLVVDEAHRGMKTNADRATIVQQVINGTDSVPPVPVVWGISATTQRFTKAMGVLKGRTSLPDAEVKIAEVQASGLLKDAILLNNPDDDGQVDTTLLREAVKRTVSQSERWANYCNQQKIEPVIPLLVVQVGNKPSDTELKRLVGVIYEEWADLSGTAMANVFGEHTDLRVAGRKVRYVKPETVQEDPSIRVLLAKDAVTTGWDCPRAEVLFSLRGGQDRTYITQLVGRMVRSPLARRITSDDLLNSVVCLLPNFNRTTTKSVADRLTKGDYDDGNGGGGGLKVYSKPVALTRNTSVPSEVFSMLTSLPSESKPNPLAKPIPRLLQMATALAGDGLLGDATEVAVSYLYEVLDNQMHEHRRAVAANIAKIRTVRVATVTVSLRDGMTGEPETSELHSDARTIDDAFGRASRVLTKAIANGYQKHLSEMGKKDDEGLDLLQAKVEVAALAIVPEAVRALTDAANEQVNKWLDSYSSYIKLKSDDRQAEYDRIRAQSASPLRRDTRLQDTKLEETVDKDDQPYPTRGKHLLSDEEGEFSVGSLNDWELKVVDTELQHPHTVAWYRNPSQATEHAIQVPYRKGDTWSTVQPDFVFFAKKDDGTLCASIVDPHGDHLADALEKLIGMADFAEKYSGSYLRVDSLAKNAKGKMVSLDLTRSTVRDAIRSASKASDLFNGKQAVAYL